MNAISKTVRTGYALNRYYVRAIKRGGRVAGYGVYDSVGGMEVEHERFPIADDAADRDGAALATLHLANLLRDDLNAEIR
ncbi:hypothetical protein ACWIGM_09155 [Bosea sp. NPDC055332]